MTRRPAALAMVALIGAGCANGGSSAEKNAAPRDKGVLFAECMRDNGISAFPDPTGSSDQEFVEGIERAMDPNSAAAKKALSACKDRQPAGLLGGKATPEEMDERLAFARCMRDNGIQDFPDPARDGPLIDTNRIPSAAGRGARDIPGFDEAMEQCRDAAANALGER